MNKSAGLRRKEQEYNRRNNFFSALLEGFPQHILASSLTIVVSPVPEPSVAITGGSVATSEGDVVARVVAVVPIVVSVVAVVAVVVAVVAVVAVVVAVVAVVVSVTVVHVAGSNAAGILTIACCSATLVCE